MQTTYRPSSTPSPRLRALPPALPLALLAPLLMAPLALVGCGSSSGDGGSATEGGGASSSGGEAEVTDGGDGGAPVVIRTTTPVPVPQPYVAREQLAEVTQAIWEGVETTIAIRPPEPPAEATEEAIQAWAEGPFATWIQARQAGIDGIRARTDEVPERPPFERGVTAGLFGYLYEETAAGIRGAPIPDDIAHDAELFQIYVQALNEALRPYALASAQSYGFCVQTFAGMIRAADGEPTGWEEWGAYCQSRGREVIEVFELLPAGAQDGPGGQPALPSPNGIEGGSDLPNSKPGPALALSIADIYIFVQ